MQTCARHCLRRDCVLEGGSGHTCFQPLGPTCRHVTVPHHVVGPTAHLRGPAKRLHGLLVQKAALLLTLQVQVSGHARDKGLKGLRPIAAHSFGSISLF